MWREVRFERKNIAAAYVRNAPGRGQGAPGSTLTRLLGARGDAGQAAQALLAASGDVAAAMQALLAASAAAR